MASGSDEKVCVVKKAFCASQPVEMVAKCKLGMYRRTHFEVVDSRDKALIFNVEGSGLRGVHVMADKAGSPILTMKEMFFTLHGRWKIYRGAISEEEHLLFQVKSTSMVEEKTKVDVFLASNTSEDKCDFHVDGVNTDDNWCTIYKGDSIVAVVSDMSTFAQSIMGKRLLMIRVYPHVDHAFIIALVAILAQIKHSLKLTAAATTGAKLTFELMGSLST